jgi:transcriptional regulator with XRE-family HTH domain
MKTKLNAEIGRRIKWLVFTHETSTRDLAKALGVTASTLYYIMNGRVPLSLDKAAKLSQYFKISLDDLLGDGSLVPIFFRLRPRISREAALAEIWEKVESYSRRLAESQQAEEGEQEKEA